MDYLIDGYNVMHHVGLLQAKAQLGPRELERARISFLGTVRARFAQGREKLIVVLDARGAVGHEQQALDYQGIQVQFTRFEEADDWMEEQIARWATPHNLTVVSNDHRVQNAARARRCVVMGCLDFWEMLKERPDKPESVQPDRTHQRLSQQEQEEWLREFADLADDPAFREMNLPDWEADLFGE